MPFVMGIGKAVFLARGDIIFGKGRRGTLIYAWGGCNVHRRKQFSAEERKKGKIYFSLRGAPHLILGGYCLQPF